MKNEKLFQLFNSLWNSELNWCSQSYNCKYIREHHCKEYFTCPFRYEKVMGLINFHGNKCRCHLMKISAYSLLLSVDGIDEKSLQFKIEART